MSGRISSPELIGRDAELGILVAAFEEAAAGRARTVLLGGEAGLGKTRLVAVATEAARARGGRVLTGGCISMAEDSLPFAPIVEALRPIVRGATRSGADGSEPTGDTDDPTASAVRRVAVGLGLAGPRARTDSVVDRPDWDRTSLYEAVLDLLATLGEGAPIVFVVEDLHWADGSTRDLLSFLARNARHERLLLVLTFRSDDLSRRHPLVPWLAEMGRLPTVERLEIGRLDRAATGRQLAGILGSAPDAATLDALHERASGNPFFLEELVAAGLDRRGLPPTLSDVLRARLAGLSEGAFSVLGMAAIAGPRIDEDLLAAVAGLPRDDLATSLREAVGAGIVVDDPDGEQRFRHALLAEAAADALLPGERRRLHALIAARLETLPPGRGVVRAMELATVAHHWTEARELPRALGAAVTAGVAAWDASASAEALRQFETALGLWDVVPDAESVAGMDRAGLLQGATNAALGCGDGDRALRHARAAIALVDPAEDPRRAGLLAERLGRALWVSGRLSDAAAAYGRAVALIPAQPPSRERARVLAGLAGNLMVATRYREAAGPAREAMEMAEALGEDVVAGHAMNTLGICSVHLGDVDAGLRMLRTALERARSLSAGAEDVKRGYANLSAALYALRRLEESVAVSLEGSEHMAHLGGGWIDFQRLNAADGLVELGRIDEACAIAAQADPGSTGVLRVMRGTFQARACLIRGDLDGARAGVALTDGLVDSSDAQLAGPLAVARSTLALLEGDPERAVRETTAVMAAIETTDGVDSLAGLCVAAARAHAEAAAHLRSRHDATGAAAHAASASGVADRATRLAEDSPAPIARWLGALAVVAQAEARRAEGVPDTEAWRAAITALDGMADAELEAYVRFRAAEAALESRGDRATADAWLREAHRAATAMGAEPLLRDIRSLARRSRIEVEAAPVVEVPAALAPGEADFGLTPRELEVLALVSEGRTNRQIGEALYMSESTAGVHVSRILGKLGVGSRAAAAAVATRLGLVARE